jgi:hypothetical protein
VYPRFPRQVYRRVPVSVIGYIFATAELPDGRYVFVGYLRGGVNASTLGGPGGVHSAIRGESGHARACILKAPSIAGPYIVLPARCVGRYGCRKRVSSLSREVTAPETVILRIELDVLTKAAMQVLYGRWYHPFLRQVGESK